MSGGGSKTTTSTQELKLPEWINQGGQQTFQAAQQAAAANPVTAYTGQIAAGSNPNLDAATAKAQDTSGGQADLERARQLTNQGATATTGRVDAPTFDSAAMTRYMDPYTASVQQNTLKEMQRQNAMQMQDLGDQSEASKAYGGMRQGVAQAELGKSQNQNMIDYLARSNADAYNNAENQFNADRAASMGAQTTNANLDAADAARAMSGGQQFAGIGSEAQGLSTDQINNLVKTGAIDQETANQMLQGNYQEFLRMQDAPMQRYMQLMGMLSGAPSDRSTTGTQTETQHNGLLSTMLGIGSIAASAFSDNRLKRDIVRIGELAKGIGLYLFRYTFGEAFHLGTMADDVEKVRPDAVTRAFGFRIVDYAKLGV